MTHMMGKAKMEKNDRRGWFKSVLHGPHGPWVWLLVTARWKRFKEKRIHTVDGSEIRRSPVDICIVSSHYLQWVFVQNLGDWPEFGTINSINL